MLVNLVTLPLTIRYLGPLQFGIWATISTFVAMLAVLDLGIANTLTNMISRAYADDDVAAARRYYATAFWVSSAIAGALCMVALVIWPHIDFDAVFGMPRAGLGHQVSVCCAIALGFFLAGLPLNLVNRVLSGYQQTQITNYGKIVSSFLSLVAILMVVWLRGSLIMLVSLYSASLLVSLLGLNVWLIAMQRRELAPALHYADAVAARELLGSGMSFFILQLAGLVVFNSDNLVIAHFLGPVEVTPYNVTWRIAGYAAILQTTISPSLWPAYAEAYARQDYRWVRGAFWNSARVVIGTVSVVALGLALFGRPLIRWYAGKAAVPTTALLLAICFWTLLSTVMDLEACLLAAVGRIRTMSMLSAFAAAVNICLSIYLVQRMGSVGVILATIVSYLLLLVGPQTVIAWRALYAPERDEAQ